MADIKGERNIDLYNAYKRKYESLGKDAKRLLPKDIIIMISEECAPKYYISPERALIGINAICHNEKEILKNKKTYQMYKELYQKYKYFLENNKIGKYLKKYQIIEDIINTPASSFFLEPETMIKLVFKQIKKHG